jgi:oxalate decarboxylase
VPQSLDHNLEKHMISRRTALSALAAATGGALTTPTSAKAEEAKAPTSYKFRLQKAKPRTYEGGSIREHRAIDFPVSHNISAGVVRMEVGTFREPHWHPNSDEWAYILEGKVRLTVVGLHGQVTTEDFDYGDAWFVPIGFGHTVVNISDGEAQILLVHNHGDFSTIELTEWVNGGPKEVFASALSAPEQALENVPKQKLFIARKKKK